MESEVASPRAKDCRSMGGGVQVQGVFIYILFFEQSCETGFGKMSRNAQLTKKLRLCSSRRGAWSADLLRAEVNNEGRT